MTVETRPDCLGPEEAQLSMELGATRVELGVQILNDKILEGVDRGHGVEEVVMATELAKKLGLKVCYHIMPGLPGSSPERDLECFQRIFDDPRFRPDMLKIYPTLVVKGTKLYDMWERGEYLPYDTERAAQVIAGMKSIVPRYVRIQRIQRDIPVPLIEAGVDKGHLRQIVALRLEDMGMRCQCIRCREVGLKGIDPDQGDLTLQSIQYEASGGLEQFISLVLDDQDALVGYVRLRIDGDEAKIRELKVFGRMAPLDQGGEWQHRGHGQTLVGEAERVAREHGCHSISVTSGVGVRGYYRSLGYERKGVYMTRML